MKHVVGLNVMVQHVGPVALMLAQDEALRLMKDFETGGPLFAAPVVCGVTADGVRWSLKTTFVVGMHTFSLENLKGQPRSQAFPFQGGSGRN